MDDPSPTARDVVAAYRRGCVLSDDARDRVQARLADSIAHSDHEGRARLETRRRIAIAAIAALAAAAGIVLLARGLRSTPTRPAEHDDRGQAPYERGDERTEPVDARTPEASATEAIAPAPAPVEIHVERATPPSRATVRSEVAPAPVAPDASLAAELAIVRSVRAAIDRDDPETALAAVAEHERRFASGQLVEERKSLRVEALCRAGKAPQARAEAQAFLREHPSSPHADRVRSTCKD
jgi:hypothetical protein